MTNTITFHLKRDLVFLCSLQNTYHNWLNLGPNRDQRTEQLLLNGRGSDQRKMKWRSVDSWLSFGHGPQGRRIRSPQAPQGVDVLAVLDLWSFRSHPSNRRGRPSFPPRPLRLVTKLLRYKAGVSGRKHGIWKSRTARTSTCWGGLTGLCVFLLAQFRSEF